MTDTSVAYSMIRKLQFHYWFGDRTHTMDALVYNKCEREVLELAKAIARLCKVPIILETEPSGKGGLKTWLTLSAKSPNRTPVSKVVLVYTLVASCIATPNYASIGDTSYLLLDRMLQEKDLDASEREQVRLAITHLKEEVGNLLPELQQHTVVKKRRSNFFSLLGKYPKVKSISVALTDDTKTSVTEEQMVVRDSFPKFLVSTNVVNPHVVEHAQIEIISPVLVPGRHKWKGVYNQKPIAFSMKSDDFMAIVQSGKVEFKSGSTITCTLEIEKKITSSGEERITGYNILDVSTYSENGKTIEATEIRQKQKPNTVSKRQLDLFG
jgi:hypothetical protein